ncbi:MULTISPECIES: hemerythrin domain-containing protein [unclassified Corallococcus]|uniref:hemerythrin domain-containing protein n=1 Tax=unclassified Corallococcus TaxID=2685029 RepID=UPI001A8C3BB2|nr:MULTISPECIES: hemerythrin domain-containing protein [unclassified Corallococcus]MBN9687998.1 hemerythrin domain-containing protein [Corallococcus sp. NCSPR001]WAS88192.1 hemerythrin domain-containing protein [Corallococcus sp. NCRR]
MNEASSRRRFLSTVVLLGAASTVNAAPKSRPAEVNATEDLMREHGVIRRTLLVYDELARRLDLREEKAPAEVLAQATRLMRRFGEDYHEKTEETEVFPRLVKAGQQKELVQVLLEQHAAGRKLTASILAAASGRDALTQPQQRATVARQLTQFIRMYRPHAAREDTVLFPAFRELFDEKQFQELGERFEAQEHRVLGSDGFENALKEVAQLERALGIHDLARFTPPEK